MAQIVLLKRGSYKDGGSRRFVTRTGRKFWQDRSISSRGTSNYNKLFEGEYNNRSKPAQGYFVIGEDNRERILQCDT